MSGFRFSTWLVRPLSQTYGGFPLNFPFFTSVTSSPQINDSQQPVNRSSEVVTPTPKKNVVDVITQLVTYRLALKEDRMTLCRHLQPIQSPYRWQFLTLKQRQWLLFYSALELCLDFSSFFAFIESFSASKHSTSLASLVQSPISYSATRSTFGLTKGTLYCKSGVKSMAKSLATTMDPGLFW